MPPETSFFRGRPPSSVSSNDDIYDDGYLCVEHARFYVSCAGNPLYNLTRKEFLILSRLVRDVERAVTKQELWDCAWGSNATLNNSTFRVHIANLRRKLAPFGLDVVVTVHVGYRLVRTVKARLKDASTNNTVNS